MKNVIRKSDMSVCVCVSVSVSVREHISRTTCPILRYERYDTRCDFNVRSKADMSRPNLAHENDN